MYHRKGNPALIDSRRNWVGAWDRITGRAESRLARKESEMRIRSEDARKTPYRKKRAGKPRLVYPSPYFHIQRDASWSG